MNDIVTVVSTVGFPIVACGAVGYFCATTLKKMEETIDKLSTQLALNTRAVDNLVQHLERREDS